MVIFLTLLLGLLGRVLAVLMASIAWYGAFKSTNFGAAIWASVMTYMILGAIKDQVVRLFGRFHDARLT